MCPLEPPNGELQATARLSPGQPNLMWLGRLLSRNQSINMAEQVIKAIEGEHHLKHVETVDKAAPLIDPSVQVKKVDRDGFLNEITSDHQLKHVETVDKATPAIDPNVHVKKVDRTGLLSDIEAGKELKHVE